MRIWAWLQQNCILLQQSKTGIAHKAPLLKFLEFATVQNKHQVGLILTGRLKYQQEMLTKVTAKNNVEAKTERATRLA